MMIIVESNPGAQRKWGAPSAPPAVATWDGTESRVAVGGSTARRLRGQKRFKENSLLINPNGMLFLDV